MADYLEMGREREKERERERERNRESKEKNQKQVKKRKNATCVRLYVLYNILTPTVVVCARGVLGKYC